MGHIELARWASRVLIAPASADFCARLANGQGLPSVIVSGAGIAHLPVRSVDQLTGFERAAPSEVECRLFHDEWAVASSRRGLRRSRGAASLGPPHEGGVRGGGGVGGLCGRAGEARGAIGRAIGRADVDRPGGVPL